MVGFGFGKSRRTSECNTSKVVAHPAIYYPQATRNGCVAECGTGCYVSRGPPFVLDESTTGSALDLRAVEAALRISPVTTPLSGTCMER